MIKPVTPIFILSFFMMAVFHFLALELFLYWRYLWLDIPMHILGGCVVALGYLSIRDFFPKLKPKWFSLFYVIAFVVIVAVLWEIFEVVIGVTFDESRYVIDTIADFIFGLLGGFIGYFVATKIRELYL